MFHHILAPTPLASRLSLLVMTGYALWACWQMYLETRLEKMKFIQIMLPDPVVELFMNSYIPIVLITLSLLVLRKVHLPLALGFFLVTPVVREALRFLDEIPGMTQPSPAITVTSMPILALLLLMAVKKRFRSLDAIAVGFSYVVILSLYMLYHVGFIFPMYEQTNHERMERLERIALMTPEQVVSEMTYLGARDVSTLSGEDIAYLNDMSDMNQEFTFPGESAARIMEAHPVSTHAWELVGRTFADRRALFYDGRAQETGGVPRLWALPADFEQTQLIIASGGFYLMITIVAYFWTLMSLFICHIHGVRVSRLQPFSRNRYLRP